MEEEARLEGGVEAKAGGEDQQAAAWPDPTEDYMELPAETRRREAEASAFRPSGLLPPVARPGKTGLLEQSRLRAAGRRPMFTFHERPRLAPNPELLSLVHGSDVQRKVGGSPDDTLGLGDEACTLSPHQAPAPAAMVCAGEEKPAPEWASCLKPPELRPPRRPGASQCLAEVRGKGAELFARRQTRMERFTIEAPLASERQLRPTSPTASLPPSWRCGGSPGSSSRPSGLVGGSSRPSGLVGVSSSAFLVKAAVKPGLQHLGLASPPPVRGAPGPRPEPTRASPRTPPPPTAAKPPSPRFNCTDTRLVLTTRSPPQADPRPTETPQAPRPTETSLAPRPTFSAGRAGLEAQGSPVTPPWKTTGEGRRSSTRTYLDTVQSDPANSTVLGSPRSPPCPLSPTAAVLSPTSWTPPRYSPATKLGSEVADSRRLKDLLAKNVVSAARRKKLSSPTLSPSSPGDLPFSLSPRSECLSPPSPSTPSPATLACSPLRMYRRSLTDSEFSLGSDDSGARSPSYYNFCPRGWTGSRVKQSEQ